jgi:hypothetical protein
MQQTIHMPNIETGKALCGASDGITALVDSRSVTYVNVNDEEINCPKCRKLLRSAGEGGVNLAVFERAGIEGRPQPGRPRCSE